MVALFETIHKTSSVHLFVVFGDIPFVQEQVSVGHRALRKVNRHVSFDVSDSFYNHSTKVLVEPTGSLGTSSVLHDIYKGY